MSQYALSKNSPARPSPFLHILGYVIGFALTIPVAIRAIVGLIGIEKTATAQNLTVDPSKPYPYKKIAGMANYDASFFDIVPVWALVLVGAFVIFALITSLLRQHLKWIIAACILTLCLLFTLMCAVDTQVSTHDTYATWAKERYGIEMTSYPQTSGGMFHDSVINPQMPVLLDDGTIVQIQEVTNSNSDKALIIIDNEADIDDRELDVIAE